MHPHLVCTTLQGTALSAFSREVVKRLDYFYKRITVDFKTQKGHQFTYAAALDMLEKALGKERFQRLFGLILTDNGTEFSDTNALERSVFGGTARCKVYYCDARQSQQKGACERNHVELRKLLPKGRGISFDALEEYDLAITMSQLNSEPRPSLMGMSALSMLRAADAEAFEKLRETLGIEDIPYERLNLTIDAINCARRERGATPLV